MQLGSPGFVRNEQEHAISRKASGIFGAQSLNESVLQLFELSASSTPCSKENMLKIALWERAGHQTLNSLTRALLAQTVVPPIWRGRVSGKSNIKPSRHPVSSLGENNDDTALTKMRPLRNWRTPTKPPIIFAGKAVGLRDQVSSVIKTCSRKSICGYSDCVLRSTLQITTNIPNNESDTSHKTPPASTRKYLLVTLRSSCFLLESLVRLHGDHAVSSLFGGLQCDSHVRS